LSDNDFINIFNNEKPSLLPPMLPLHTALAVEVYMRAEFLCEGYIFDAWKLVISWLHGEDVSDSPATEAVLQRAIKKFVLSTLATYFHLWQLNYHSIIITSVMVV